MKQDGPTALWRWVFNLRSLLALAATALILWLLIRRVSLDQVRFSLALAPGWLWLGLGASSSLYLLGAGLRWQLILRAMNISLPLERCVCLAGASFALNTVTPAKAGDLIKVPMMKDVIDPWRCAGGVLAEKLIDLGIVLVLGLAGAYLTGHLSLACVFAVALLVMVALLWAGVHISFFQKRKSGLAAKLQMGSQALVALSEQPRYLSQVFFVALAIRLLNYGQIALLARYMGFDVGFWLLAGALSVAVCVGLLPISLAGAGTRDAALIVMLDATIPAAGIVALGLAFTFLTYVLPGAMGAVFLGGLGFGRTSGVVAIPNRGDTTKN
ncbi:MAG: lysylphosphatidylglycerol synthase transmembrane domain-containing protein [Desulfobaccales bacterium]